MVEFARKRGAAVLMAVALAVPSALFAQEAVASADDAVAPELWTTNFPAALARARAEHRPLLLAGGLAACASCANMRKDLDDKLFRAWVKGTGMYLVQYKLDLTNASPHHAEAAAFVQATRFHGERDIPHFTVYWPRLSNDEVRLAFSYHHGEMPAHDQPAVVLECVQSLEGLLADYLRAFGPRPALDALVASTTKTITAAARGPGSVRIAPADGVLRCGKVVRISTAPAPGAYLRGWLGPDGKVIRGKRNRTLTIPYQQDEGTYTAVFGSRR